MRNSKYILLIFVALLLLSVAFVYFFRKNVDYTLGNSIFVELTANVDTTEEAVANAAEELDDLAEVKVLENELYQLYLNNDISEDQVREKVTPLTASGTVVDFFESRSIAQSGLWGRVIYLSLWFVIGFTIFGLIYRGQFNKLQKILIIDLALFRVISVGIILFGIIFAGTISGLYLVGSWAVSVVAGLTLLSLFIKVIEYAYFSEYFSDTDKKLYLEKYVKFMQEEFSPKLYIIFSILLILSAGLFVLMEIPFVLGIVIVALFILTEILITKYVAPELHTLFYRKLISVKFIENSRFWTR